MAAHDYTRSFNSFSGVDLTVLLDDSVVGEIQAVSCVVNREIAPVYTLGDPKPKSFSRGKRGVAGSLVSIVFDRHALLDTMKTKHFYAYRHEARPVGLDGKPIEPYSRTPFGTIALSRDPATVQEVSKTQVLNTPIAAAGDNRMLSSPWYSDQIPPFDITGSFANEFGATAVMRIFGVQIINEGFGVSIDDIVTEMQYTFVAIDIQHITPQLGSA